MCCELERDGLSSADAGGLRLLADRGKYAAQNKSSLASRRPMGLDAPWNLTYYRKTYGFKPAAVADRSIALDLAPIACPGGGGYR
jgi:hypothetical protein